MDTRYSGKSVLLVDRSHDDLGTLRSFLSRLGFTSIIPASSVNMALSLMREMRFDLVFAVYDMGADQKSGLQLLQEANQEKSLSFSSCFFLVVDRETSELLFGSLEDSPDNYVSKPYEYSRLQTLIEKQLRMKQAIAPVENLIDIGKLESVAQACDAVISHYPGLTMHLQRIKGIALLRLGQSQQALTLFEQLTQKRELPWAEVGKGMASYHLGRFHQAADYFHRLIDQGQICVEAYLWLARCYRASCELERAVVLMRKAVLIQPTMPLLQAELADLAYQAGHYELAVNAFREAMNFSQHSIYQSPDFYLGCGRALAMCENTSTAEREMVEVLERVVMEFDDSVVKFLSKLTMSVFYRQVDNNERQRHALLDAWELYLTLPLTDQCERMELMADAVQDTDLADDFQELRRQLNKSMLELPWGRLNIQGMASFKKGEISRAHDCFGAALQALPGHMSIALNRVQTSMELVKQDPLNALPLLLKSAEILRGISFAALTRTQQVRYTRFSERCAALLQQLNTEV